MPEGWLWKCALGELRLLAGFVAAEMLVLILGREKLYRGMDCAMIVSIQECRCRGCRVVKTVTEEVWVHVQGSSGQS